MSRFAIAPEFEERVRRDEPMSRHTSWHVGGPADAEAVATLVRLCPMSSVARGVTA